MYGIMDVIKCCQENKNGVEVNSGYKWLMKEGNVDKS